MRWNVLPLLCAAAFAGCGSFGKDRALDFAQSFEFGAGWSEGLEVNLRATKVAQAGIGAYRGIYWAGLKDGVFDVWMEERSELGIGPLYIHEVFRSDTHDLLGIQHPLFGDPGFREHSWDVKHLTDRDWFDFGATVNVALVGFNVAFKGAEFADFMGGWFGYDMLEDDVHTRETHDLLNQVGADDARVRAAAARAILLREGDDFGYAIYTAPRELPPQQRMAIDRMREELSGAAPPAPDSTTPPQSSENQTPAPTSTN